MASTVFTKCEPMTELINQSITSNSNTNYQTEVQTRNYRHLGFMQTLHS